MISSQFRAAFLTVVEQRWKQPYSVETPSHGVLSLDVFDTLLIRDSFSELRRFWEIAERIAQFLGQNGHAKLTAPDALVARYHGTLASYRASRPVRGCREGSINEIHENASLLLTGSRVHAETFIDIELEYETARAKPNQLLLDFARDHRARGGRVILMTDMYLHAHHVKALLRRTGIDIQLFDLLISSADEKVSKASGGLFPIAEQKLRAPPEAFLHVGDSLYGDYLRPRNRGWAAVLLPVTNSERRQRRIDHAESAIRLQREHGLQLPLIRMPD